MAYQKTDGTWDDAKYIVSRLREGFSYEEACSGMVMPIDPGTPERPGWCWRNRKLFEGWAVSGLPAQGGLSSPSRKPLTYLADKDGKMWAIFADNTREEIVPAEAPKAPPPQEPREMAAGAIPVSTDLSMAAKKSRKKLVTKEW